MDSHEHVTISDLGLTFESDEKEFKFFFPKEKFSRKRLNFARRQILPKDIARRLKREVEKQKKDKNDEWTWSDWVRSVFTPKKAKEQQNKSDDGDENIETKTVTNGGLIGKTTMQIENYTDFRTAYNKGKLLVSDSLYTGGRRYVLGTGLSTKFKSKYYREYEVDGEHKWEFPYREYLEGNIQNTQSVEDPSETTLSEYDLQEGTTMVIDNYQDFKNEYLDEALLANKQADTEGNKLSERLMASKFIYNYYREFKGADGVARWEWSSKQKLKERIERKGTNSRFAVPLKF